MARKTFISYKYNESCKYRDKVIESLGDDATYYTGETADSPDISNLKVDSIKNHLKDMIFNTQYYYVLALKARTDYMFCAGFFHTRKNLKNFSKEVIKSHLAVLIWCGKRDKHFSNHKGKEVRLMKPSDFQKTVQCRFESCLKKVVRSVVKDYYKELNRRKNKEISFSELPDVLVDKMAVWDDYETDYTIFSVCGIDIRVLDDELAEALKKLPERKRNTLLMYYFLEMTESEIANLQKITQSGVFRNRHHALETMKKILKEEH